MRSLEQALAEHELIVLRVIGEWWELDLMGEQKGACVKALSQVLSQLDMPTELTYLPPEEADAMSDLVVNGGRMPVASFSRQHGEVRQMGPGKMEREEPWLEPESSAEALFYRGFLYRGFDEMPEGVLEFYYLPDELLNKFPQEEAPPAHVVAETAVSPINEPDTTPQTDLPSARSAPPMLEPMRNAAVASLLTAVSHAVDDMTTLLAFAQRTAFSAEERKQLGKLLLNPNSSRRTLLLTIAGELGLLRQTKTGLKPTRTAVKWLQQGRDQQLRTLAEGWSNSAWNDLRHTPGLICEGEAWQNDPLLPRTTLIDYLPREAGWVSLADFTAAIAENDPDFQRPDGNYDTWYIRDAASNQFLSGFESWPQVEGRLLSFLISGSLYWLGMTETGKDEAGDHYFRLTEQGLRWLEQRPFVEDTVQVPMVVQAGGVVQVPFNANRYQRFQVARIADAQPLQPNEPFSYRLTPNSLDAAQEQGIDADRVLQFLASASGRTLPAGVKRAVGRWNEKGVEGRIEQAIILRVRDEAILDILRTNPKTRDFIGESLGDLAATVRQEDWESFLEATAGLGLLLDVNVMRDA
ncbi:MAG: helicase-associated domain-containing protein [Chloroflexota bacterium]